MFERHLVFDGTFNFRDLGRYRTADGRLVRERTLFRSGALDHLSSAVADEVVERLGVRTVIDLRYPDGTEADSTALGPLPARPGVRHVPLPLLPPRVEGRVTSEVLDAAHGPGPSGGRYFGYLDFAAPAITGALAVLAEPAAYPAIIHCTAGKDRTGVLTALLLDTLGVPPETIVDDYALSNASLPALIAHLRAMGRVDGTVPVEALARYGAPVGAISGFLERLHAAHGSARGYLASIGVPAATLDAVAACLLDDLLDNGGR